MSNKKCVGLRVGSSNSFRWEDEPTLAKGGDCRNGLVAGVVKYIFIISCGVSEVKNALISLENGETAAIVGTGRNARPDCGDASLFASMWNWKARS